MEVLKNAGTFTILTPENELQEQLLRIERAGRTCYQSDSKPITRKSAKDFICMLLQRGHESVIEHSCMTVKFHGVSRGFTHEMVRHRLASYSQESTRYVDYAKEGDSAIDLDRFNLRCVVPPHRDEHQEHPVLLPNLRTPLPMSIVDMFCTIENMYRALRKAGWHPQDARQVLPIGTESDIVVSANLREWRHIFRLRTGKPAHWEIRKVMGDLLTKVQILLPGVFGDFAEAGIDKNGIKYFEVNL